MTTEATVEKKGETTVEVAEEQVPTYIPSVDIYEAPGSFRVMAGMPGADRESVSVTVENSILTIEGTASLDLPEGHASDEGRSRARKYRREFSLPDAVDVEGITARVNNGLVSVTLPKVARVQNHKVKISA